MYTVLDYAKAFVNNKINHKEDFASVALVVT